jgi:hypothetical protein
VERQPVEPQQVAQPQELVQQGPLVLALEPAWVAQPRQALVAPQQPQPPQPQE